jgi:hypothetical protein
MMRNLAIFLFKNANFLAIFFKSLDSVDVFCNCQCGEEEVNIFLQLVFFTDFQNDSNWLLKVFLPARVARFVMIQHTQTGKCTK